MDLRWLYFVVVVSEAKKALDYSLNSVPEKACDKVVWQANMNAWKVLNKVQ